MPACTHVRSTLIGSSILALKRHGYFETYERHLPLERREVILYGVAGLWLPIDVGIAHYTACGAMNLPTDEIVALGASVAGLAQKTMFSFVRRVATEAGLTPWTAISKAQVFWERSYRGSAVAAFKLGPKECRLDTVGNPLAASPYWRASFRGIVTALIEAFSQRVFVRELPWSEGEPWSASYRMSWV